MAEVSGRWPLVQVLLPRPHWMPGSLYIYVKNRVQGLIPCFDLIQISGSHCCGHIMFVSIKAVDELSKTAKMSGVSNNSCLESSTNSKAGTRTIYRILVFIPGPAVSPLLGLLCSLSPLSPFFLVSFHFLIYPFFSLMLCFTFSHPTFFFF